MGTETFYCVQCGVRVSGVDVRGDRSHCPSCLGLPVEPTPRPARDSSKRIRKPSGTAMAVATLPRTPEAVRPGTSRVLIVGALSFIGAVLFALTTFLEKSTCSISQPPEPQPVEKTNRSISHVEKRDCSISQEPDVLPKPLERLRDEPQRPAPPPPDDPAIELLADEIEEAASALADEGRFEDALGRIRAFPEVYRKTRAWNSLDGLRRQIEARARSR